MACTSGQETRVCKQFNIQGVMRLFICCYLFTSAYNYIKTANYYYTSGTIHLFTVILSEILFVDFQHKSH